MIYPIVFIASSLSLAASIYFEDRSNKLLKVFFLCLAVFIPSVLGGLRSEYVGTDNQPYKLAFLEVAGISSFSDFLTLELGVEFLYGLLEFLISRFTTDYHWLCFATELITMIFITAGIKNFKDHIPVGIGMLIYLFCYYCNMLNLVRQGISLAICFYALKYAIEKHWAKYCFFVLCAALFHSSAYVALLIIVIVKLVSRAKNIRIMIGLILVLMFGLSFVPKLLELFVPYGIFPEKYLTYITSEVTFSLKHTVYRLPVLLLATIFYKRIAEIDDYYRCFYAMLWGEMIFAQMASVLDSAYRISLYFGYSSIVILPMFKWAFKNNKDNKICVYTLIFIYVVLYWVYFCVFNNFGFRNPTYPFESDII